MPSHCTFTCVFSTSSQATIYRGRFAPFSCCSALFLEMLTHMNAHMHTTDTHTHRLSLSLSLSHTHTHTSVITNQPLSNRVCVCALLHCVQYRVEAILAWDPLLSAEWTMGLVAIFVWSFMVNARGQNLNRNTVKSMAENFLSYFRHMNIPCRGETLDDGYTKEKKRKRTSLRKRRKYTKKLTKGVRIIGNRW